MKHPIRLIKAFSLILVTGFFCTLSCKKDTNPDPSLPVVTISTDRITGKAAQPITITVTMTAPSGIKSLIITKGLNLVTDSSFGENGIFNAPVSAGSGGSDVYEFHYIVDSIDIDKLVGFNFKLTDQQGRSVEKDLTLTAQTSGALTIYSYKWDYTSRKVVSINFEAIENCEKDNLFMYRKDSSTVLDYGLSACVSDSSVTYFKWALSNDETSFTQWYYPKGFPDSVKTETYTVITLTNKKLTLEKTEDLTGVGLSDAEKVQYSYNAVPY